MLPLTASLTLQVTARTPWIAYGDRTVPITSYMIIPQEIRAMGLPFENRYLVVRRELREKNQ